jgi:hypothetical protein
VLPPVERLCTEIEGTEKSRLADCLGLDTSRFSLHTAGSNDVEREFHTLESQISDAERFKDAELLKLRCRRCTTEMTYAGMLKDEVRFALFGSAGAKSLSQHHMVRPSGITCINADCCSILDINSITVQVEIQIRSFIAKFYESWLVCDDASCATRTRQMSVYGKRCLAAGCRGTMHYDVSSYGTCVAFLTSKQYSDARLYNQLLFFDHMFDVEKAKASAAGTSSQGASSWLRCSDTDPSCRRDHRANGAECDRVWHRAAGRPTIPRSMRAALCRLQGPLFIHAHLALCIVLHLGRPLPAVTLLPSSSNADAVPPIPSSVTLVLGATRLHALQSGARQP